MRPEQQAKFLADNFQGADTLGWKDYGTPTQRQDGHLVGAKGMLTVLEKVQETDLIARVDANSDAEAGLVLRFQDPDHYIVALYTPSLKAIYLHDRKAGAWGPPLGRVDVPTIGRRIRLTGAVCGGEAALVLTDGTNTYTTPSVTVSNRTSGKAGLWLFQVGERQQYDNFELCRLSVQRPQVPPRGQPLVLRENPGILPALPVPPWSLLLGDTYTPPRLPAPQDWLLVLERIK